MVANPRQPEYHDLPEPVELTPQQAREMFDRVARYYLGMSGEEFLRAYDAGEIDVDGPDHLRIIPVEMLIPLVR